MWRTFAKVSQLIAFEPPAPPLPFETLSHTNAGKDELVNKLVNMTCYKKMVHPELPLAELKDAEVSKDTKEAANLSDCKKYVFFTVGAVPCAVTAYQAMRPRV